MTMTSLSSFADDVGRSSQIDDELSLRLIRLDWERVPAFAPAAPIAGIQWFVRGSDGNPVADALATQLQKDDDCSVVRTGLVGDGAIAPAPNGREERHVVVLADPSTAPWDAVPGGPDWAWAHATVAACQAVLTRPGSRIWLVTNTCMAGNQGARPMRPEHDFARALGRCLAAEAPEAFGGVVDLAIAEPDAAAAELAAYLRSGSPEDEVLLEDAGASVARLRASTLPQSLMGPAISSDRLSIVSGGLLGLSFEVERWLAGSGATRLLVLGSSPLDAEREKNLAALEATGCSVTYEVLDVGAPAQVRALIGRLRDNSERVGGVFHLASRWRIDGRSSPGSLTTASPEQTELLLGTKANGALLLGELAKELGAEALVLFSSAAATLGSPGQATYAAANGVLDGVARNLNRYGLRALSVSWGPIGGVGFGASAAGSDLHDVWERLGLRRLTVDQVLSALNVALGEDEPNLTVLAWDDSMKDPPPWWGQRPVLQELASGERTGLALPGLEGLAPDERLTYVIGVLQGNLANILNRPPEKIDPDQPLVHLGVDSLIALEMLFVVEREFAVRPELDQMFLGADVTLRSLAHTLERRLAGCHTVNGAQQ